MLENYYQYEYMKLKKLFGDDWYLYKNNSRYYLSVGDVELSFMSLKFDFRWIVDWISVWFLLGKQSK